MHQLSPDQSVLPLKPQPAGSSSRSTHKEVMCVVERDNRTFWLRVGTAFENRDGSLTVLLDALPVGGKLQVRAPRERLQ